MNVCFYLSCVSFVCRNFSNLHLQALVRTLYVSGIFAAADTLIKIIFVFGLHIPLFLYGYVHSVHEMMYLQELSQWLSCNLHVVLMRHP